MLREDLTEKQRGMTPGFNGPVWEETEVSGKIEPNLKKRAHNGGGDIGDCKCQKATECVGKT